MVTSVEVNADPVDAIPPVDVIQQRLYRLRNEIRLLTRLIPIAESKAIVFPRKITPAATTGGQQ
jgi:hypothetical protein